MLGFSQRGGEALLAIGHIPERLRAGTQVFVRVGKVGTLADERDGATLTPALADARIEHCGLEPRVGADKQNDIGSFDTLNAAVEEIASAAEPRIELGAVLAAVEIGRAEASEEIAQGEHLLSAGKVTGNGTDPLRLRRLQPGGNQGQHRIPAAGLKPPVRA